MKHLAYPVQTPYYENVLVTSIIYIRLSSGKGVGMTYSIHYGTGSNLMPGGPCLSQLWIAVLTGIKTP